MERMKERKRPMAVALSVASSEFWLLVVGLALTMISALVTLDSLPRGSGTVQAAAEISVAEPTVARISD